MITLKEWCSIVEQNPERLFAEYEARSYVPIDAKLHMIDIATHGFKGKDDDKSYVSEPLCIDKDETGFATINTVTKSLYLMQIYLTVYFNVDFDGVDFTSKEYDNIVSRGYQQRINKLCDRGSTAKIKRQVIEQQNDFKAFEKMLNKELGDEVARINDPYKRMQPFAGDLIEAILDRINMDISPEKVANATEELKRLTEEAQKRTADLHIVKDKE